MLTSVSIQLNFYMYEVHNLTALGGQIDWFISELHRARQSNLKVLVAGHIPFASVQNHPLECIVSYCEKLLDLIVEFNDISYVLVY